MNKRNLIIIGVVILLSLAAGMVLLLSPKSEPDQKPDDMKSEIKKLSDDQVVSPVLSFDSHAVWYFTPAGKLFRIKGDGSELSEFSFVGIENTVKEILWPKSSGDFIAITMSAEGEIKQYYDDNLKIYVKLPANIQSMDWLPDDRRVVYIWKSSDNVHQQLVMANPDASGFKVIKEVFWPDLKVKASPNGKTVLLVKGRLEGQSNKIYQANLENGEFRTIVEEGMNLETKWITAEKFLFAKAATGLYPKLFLYNFNSYNTTDLNLQTSLDKTVLDPDGKFLYAAVPKKDSAGDEFVKIDLATFKQEVIYKPEQDVRPKNLLFTTDKLYFVNSRDSKLYSLSLNK